MKTLIPFFAILLILPSCHKHNHIGDIQYKLRYTTSEILLKKGTITTQDEHYTQFGDYITSLTPTKFTAKIWTMGYMDGVWWNTQTNSTNILSYVRWDGSMYTPAQDSIQRSADFSNNATVTFENPGMNGQLNGEFFENNVDFKYFFFVTNFLYQEVQLPTQYEGIQLTAINAGFNATVENNILKSQHKMFMKPIFPNGELDMAFRFYFGNTDSAFVVNPNGEMLEISEDNPLDGGRNYLTFRSDKYSHASYRVPDEGETLTMSGVVSFNSTDLIQVYAGADNVPYTSDDVFVYAPKFWERISSRLNME